MYLCYVKNDHPSPQCNLSMSSMYKVILNYEALTDEERSRVPSASYDAAVQYFKSKEAAKDASMQRRKNDGSIDNNNDNSNVESKKD